MSAPAALRAEHLKTAHHVSSFGKPAIHAPPSCWSSSKTCSRLQSIDVHVLIAQLVGAVQAQSEQMAEKSKQIQEQSRHAMQQDKQIEDQSRHAKEQDKQIQDQSRHAIQRLFLQ